MALIEPTPYVGGMAGPGGIGLRDIGNLDVINSTALEWAMLNAAYYKSSGPVWQPDHYVGNTSFWTMLSRYSNLDVLLNERLVENTGVTVTSGRVTELITAGPDGTSPSKTVYKVGYVVDASYEGDVMRFAGVGHTIGRESRAQYNESDAGIIAGSANAFEEAVPATWSNGSLLNWVQDLPDPRTRVGEADDNVMAYSFRLCLTTRPDNRLNISAPPGYTTEAFELSRRYIQLLLAAGKSLQSPWGNLPYRSYPPGDKFDACCGAGPVGIDAAGLARGYSNGTYAEREAIKQQHRFYVQGLAYFWTQDPNSGVPAETQRSMQAYGLCKDEWAENEHYPPQLYVREAARMVGDQVYTQNDRLYSGGPGGCREDSIGCGAWGFDIHQMERVPVATVDAAGPLAYNEGLTSPGQGGNVIFDLPYWLLLPKRAEVTNLLVPNCPSVTHVAFAALREEPTLWQMGQAAGTAAAIAASSSTQPVVLQDLDTSALQASLLNQGIIYHWPMRPNCSSPIPPPSVKCPAYTVQGAGSADCNGRYALQSGSSGDGGNQWVKDSQHAIYLYEQDWHIAWTGQQIYYQAPGASTQGGPPLTGWQTANATAPAPTLVCVNTTTN